MFAKGGLMVVAAENGHRTGRSSRRGLGDGGAEILEVKMVMRRQERRKGELRRIADCRWGGYQCMSV